MSYRRTKDTILSTTKRQYRPVSRPGVPQDPLQYRNTCGIDWAYRVIEMLERESSHFAQMSDQQFAWALAKAREADRGHEHNYIVREWEPYTATDLQGKPVTRRRDRWFNENREELLTRARENVRMWASAYAAG